MDAPRHTLVFSDIHLTTAIERDPAKPLWKRYQQRDMWVDGAIARMLAHVRGEVDRTVEVVLNGDIFDFDAVVHLPNAPEFPIRWLEKLRGLNPTEVKSTWKMARILDDHPTFVQALRDMLAAGHHVIFVIGNHDLELHWPAVQRELKDRLHVEGGGEVRVCEWFYVSGGDTLIEHGNQYDTYCLAIDPVSPLVRVPPMGEARVRLPFGNYASRYMVNGMGLFNPHVSTSFIMPFWGYVVFFYRHVARIQPFLLWTWFWTAMVTFLASLRDGILPAEKDVLHLEDRVNAIAQRANAEPRVARALDALRAHPAIFFPWRVARELWLDRVLLVLALILGSFQINATASAVLGVSLWWWPAILMLLLPPFVFYANRISSEADNLERELRRRVGLIGRVADVQRIVLGHTHAERHTSLDGVEVLNAGTWSPAFRDVACTEPVGRKCVVRLWPRPDGTREATLESWTDAGFERIPFVEAKPISLLMWPKGVGEAGVSGQDAEIAHSRAGEP